MKPLHHANSSVRKYGGCVDDYIKIHSLIDYPKIAYAHVRHRAVFHNTLGPWIAEQVFGEYLTNSDGRDISVRQIAEDHVVEDVGFIPTLEKWLSKLPIENWMDRVSNMKNSKKVIDFKD
jgi:hypothetical protein